MTEYLLEKLEEKVISILSELETSRNELEQLKQENASLKVSKANSVKKLENIVSLLNALDSQQPLIVNSPEVLQEKNACVID